MAVLAPIYLWLAVAGVGVVVAAHYLVIREPRGSMLPTARFVPEGRRTVRRLARPLTDVLLLALRSAALLSVGLAFGNVRIARTVPATVSVVMADVSRDVADPAEVARAAHEWLGPRQELTGIRRRSVLIVFDSSGRIRDPEALDSLARDSTRVGPGGPHGSLTAALVSGIRAAAAWRAPDDSVELTLVSPATLTEVDAATDSVRALWPGALRVVRVAARAAGGGAVPAIVWGVDCEQTAQRAASYELRVTAQPPAVSSAPCREEQARWMPRGIGDTVGAVVAGDVVVTGRFIRQSRLDDRNAQVVARWVDGEPAAIEHAGSGSCVRDVDIPHPAATDVGRHLAWRRLVKVLSAPCGEAGLGNERRYGPRAEGEASAAPTWRPAAPANNAGVRVAGSAIMGAPDPRNPAGPWLIGLVLAFRGIETLVRRRAHPDESSVVP